MNIPDYYQSLLLFTVIVACWTKFLIEPSSNKELKRLNKKVELLLNHFQLQPDKQCVLVECRRRIASKGKIEAIKYYREMTGVSLVEAKEEIDAL